MKQTKKQFIINLIVIAILIIALIVFVSYRACNEPKQRIVIYPEEFSEVKTNDSLIVIKANADTVEIGFNNAKNR